MRVCVHQIKEKAPRLFSLYLGLQVEQKQIKRHEQEEDGVKKGQRRGKGWCVLDEWVGSGVSCPEDASEEGGEAKKKRTREDLKISK